MAPFRDRPFAPELISIDAGTFRMGTDRPPSSIYQDESPARDATIGPFAVGRYPVTFSEFLLFAGDAMPGSPFHAFIREFAKPRPPLPVVMVSWYDAVAYCEWLSDSTRHRYRLLSEPEWEYVCRAGTTTAYWWGDTFDARRANCQNASIDMRTFRAPRTLDDARRDMKYLSPVDRFPANPWGVSDTSGNTWEWTADVYTDPQLDPVKMVPDLTREPFRITRGGSWMDPPLSLRSAARSWSIPSARDRIIGFRVARDD